MTPVERFENLYIPEPNSGCWLWLGTVYGRGYGLFWTGEKRKPAHRYSYEQFVAPIPDGLVIDHLCRVPCCVNPDHMEPVTSGENTRRGDSPVAEL